MSWLERRKNYVNNIVGPRPQVGPMGANPMDGYTVSQAELDAEKAYDQRWASEGMKWYNSLSPTDRSAFDSELNAHNSKIKRAGKIVKPLALGTIAAAGLGAGLQAAGGLNGLFGSATAPTTAAPGLEAATMADIAGGLNPAYGTAAYDAAFAASPGVAAASSAPALTGIDAAMADLATSGGLTPGSMGAATGTAAGATSLLDKLKNLIGPGVAGTETKGTGGIGGLVSSLIPGLAGIYTNYTQNKDLSNLTDSVLGLFGGNSAYEKALRQQLERRDAASGRRSQYGPREVELQAALAKLASNQVNSLTNLYGAQNISRNNLLNSVGEVLGGDQGPWSAVGGLINQIPWGQLGTLFGD